MKIVKRSLVIAFALFAALSIIGAFVDSEEQEEVVESPNSGQEEQRPDLQLYKNIPNAPEKVRRQKEIARGLLDELIDFKDESKFQECGFGACGSYSEWKRRVERLREQTTTDFMNYTGVTVAKISQLALEYLQSGGEENAQTRSMRKELTKGLRKIPEISNGEGIIVGTDRACDSMERFNQFARAMNNENFDEDILTEPHCPRIYQNTIVKGPLDEAQNINGTWFVKIKMPKNREVWISVSQVAFKNPES